MEERENNKKLHDSRNQELLKKYNETIQLINNIEAQLQLGTDNEIVDDSNYSSLDQDTFSIMMTSSICSSGWLLGLVTFNFQIGVVILILDGLVAIAKEARTPLGAPYNVNTSVRVGQLLAVVLSVFTQNDVFTAIKYIIYFRKHSPKANAYDWRELLVDKSGGDIKLINSLLTSDNTLIFMVHWFHRAMIPNLLKLIQGLLVLVISLGIIVQSSKLIDLLKDFTSLFFISEIDDYVFKIAAHGYLGSSLKQRTKRVRSVRIGIQEQNENCDYPKPGVLGFLIVGMIVCLGFIVQGQVSGEFFKKRFPNCGIPKNSIAKIGNGICDGGRFYSYECGFDGGDCITLKFGFPSCNVTDPSLIGDGNCNEGQYSSEACGFDGGDCIEKPFPGCNVSELSWIGDGFCNGGQYLSEACGVDEGDCDECLSSIMKENETKSRLGNLICDGGVYNSEPCGFDDKLVEEISSMGNGICDLGMLMSKLCGFDGGYRQEEEYNKLVEDGSLIGDRI